MERYIEQLLNDIRLAYKKIIPPHEIWLDSEADPDDEVELEDISFVEQFIYGEKVPVSNITGIEREQLPPEERLSCDQKALLSSELEKLLEYFHFYLDFPQNYPLPFRYSFIRNFWNEKHVYLSFGESHIEFCRYDENNCPFPGYCNLCSELKSDDIIRIDEKNYPSDEEIIIPF